VRWHRWAAWFVGLFGTVWGIMNSFIGMSESHTTNLAVVAPGIAEALLATAMGLVAAIPAVVIYNHLVRVIGGYGTLLDDASAQLPETRAPPKSEHIGRFTEAGSKAYNALVFGQLQKFKRYPSAARGKSGTVIVRFVLNRAGDVIGSTVTKSSGNDVLDREAIEIL